MLDDIFVMLKAKEKASGSDVNSITSKDCTHRSGIMWLYHKYHAYLWLYSFTREITEQEFCK